MSTAYDIAGRGRADVNALVNAFAIACRMGCAQRAAPTPSMAVAA